MTVGIVTGAGRGMGAACAERMADMVDVLVLVDRDEASLATQADMLAAAGHAPRSSPSSSTSRIRDGSPASSARVAELGPLRAVAHAAGLSPTMADWREILTVNLIGTARLVEACRAAGVGGHRRRLLRVGGGVARPRPETFLPTPCSTIHWPTASSSRSARRSVPRSRIPAWPTPGANAACTGWSAGRPCAFGQVGARICSVTPGMIDTPMGRQEAEARDTSAMLVDMSPIHREGRPDEVAAGAVFLLSDEASFISGIDLPVDGGLVAAIRGGGVHCHEHVDMNVVNVKDLLDPELRPVLDAFELPAVRRRRRGRHAGGVLRLPGPLRRGDADRPRGPGDPPVPVRVHRAKDAEGLSPAIVTIHGGGYVIGSYDMDSPLLDRWCPNLGVVGVSVEYRLAPETQLPRTARGLLRSAALDLRQRGRARHRQGHASASTGSAPGAGWPPGWRCSPVIAARSRWPSCCSTAPCSTTASRRRPSGPTGSTCGAQGRTSSAGAPTSVRSTAPMKSRPTPQRRGRPTSPGSRPPASSSAPSTASATRTSTTPSG